MVIICHTCKPWLALQKGLLWQAIRKLHVSTRWMGLWGRALT